MKKVLLIVIIGWAVLFGIDYILCLKEYKPLIVFKTNTSDYKEEYISLGYKTVAYQLSNKKVYKMYPLFYVDNGDFDINEPTSCNKKDTFFYEDENYEYYFFCDKTVMLKFNNGIEISVSEALKNNFVTIDKLKDNGLNFGKKTKNSYTIEIDKVATCNYYDGDIKFLKEINNKLSYYCLNDVNIYVNTDYYSLEKALEIYNIDDILLEMKKEMQYENGDIMYSLDNYRILRCINDKIVIGTDQLQNFEFLCN